MRTEIRHKGKKLLCLLLVLCMMFSIMPMGVLAEDTETEQTASEETTAPETESPESEATQEPTSEPTSEPEITKEPEAKTGEEKSSEAASSEAEETPAPNMRAAGDPINAALYDDSGTWVNFDGANDSATIGYASDAEKDYSMMVVLTFPSAAVNKSATITLAEGLKFQDDGSGDATVSTLLDSVVNSTNAAPYGLGSSMTNTGSKTYNFKAGVEVVTLSLSVRADSRYWYDNAIDNAITVTMNYDGSQQYEVQLEKLTVNSSNKTLHTANGNYTGYAAMDTNITLYGQDRQFFFAMSTWNVYSHFFGSLEAIFTVSNPNCIVTNTDPANWTLDDTYAAIGIYTFKYKGTGGAGLAASFVVPIQFNFPSSAFSAGEEVTVYRNSNAELYGGKTVFWPQRTMKFTIVGGDSEVFVNYTSVASAISASTLNESLTALSGSTSPTLNGTVGSYSVGNRGGKASGAQTVELHFDEDMLGVLALDLAIPYYKQDGTTRETVTQVEYQTVNGSGWVTKTGLSLTAYEAVNQYRYISWATLGITQDPMETGNYITAIRYTLSSIPAASVLGVNNSRNGIFGVTLSPGIGQKAESTVSVYDPVDAADESKWTTGKIYSDHTRNYIALHFGSVSSTSVSRSAGETFSFSHRILVYASNRGSGAYISSAVEHPIIYLRSESGNPISNIKIVNTRGTDITSYLDIDSSLVGGVWTYKIDTSNVPGDGAAIAAYSVLSNGTLNGKDIFVSYDIATQPTDSGTYDYVDMLFVETPPPTDYTNYAARSATPLGPHNIGTGTGRVWWLTASNLGSYTIEPRTDIAVSLSAKHYRAADSAYAAWSAGSNPIAIGVGNNSAMDIKLDVKNLSGMAVTSPTTIYLPIPKEGENWSSLMYNGAFEFSMVLKDEITLPIGVSGTVTYGNVNPTDNGDTLNGYTFGAWNSANAGDYNCVKIVLNGLSDSSNPVSITMQVAVDQGSPGLTDGMVDIWSPYYYEDLTNSEGKEFKMWVQGSYLATETAMGEIQGWIWLDDNIDGIKDTSENSLTITAADGWTVDVYAAGTVGTGSPLQTVTIGEDDDGSAIDNYYHITDILSGSGKYDLVVNNPDNTQYIFTRIGTGITDNKTAGTAADQHTTGTISNPTAAVPTGGTLGTEEALYNIGVIPAGTTFSLTWQSQDATKGTVTVTGADTGSSTKSSGKPYETIRAAVTAAAAAGYTFAGWSVSAAGAVDSSIPKTGPYGANGLYGYDDIDYYAVWTANSYHLFFDYQGADGGNTEGSRDVTYNTAYGVLPVPSKTNYTFGGWYTAANGGGVEYLNNGTYMVTGNTTLYAKWTANIYTVTYKDHNQDDILSLPSAYDNARSYTYGTGLTIPAAKPYDRTGYTFDGWYDAAAGGNKVISISTTDAGNKILYARWTANTYSIIYENLNGVSNTNPANYTYGVGVTSFVNPGERTGYTFAGWYDEATNGNTVTAISTTATGNKTLYARWIPNAYQINVKYETRTGGSVTGKTDFAASANHDSTYVPTAAETAAPTGYVLVGWKLNGTLQSGTSPSINPVSGAATITLVYGLDRGATGEDPATGTPDGIEDIVVTKQWYDTVVGIYMLPSVQKVVNVGDSFSDLHDLITGYDYKGYMIDNGILQAGDPNRAVSGGDADFTITYVYERLNYQVQVSYELRDGSALPGMPGFTRSVGYATTYSPQASEMQVTDYVLVDWKLNGTLVGNTSPSFTVLVGGASITLVYGRDSSGDGIEDYDVTRKWEMTDGSSITGLPSQVVAVNVNSTFNMAHNSGVTVPAGLDYQGYRLSTDAVGDPLHTGVPSYTVNVTDGDVTVTYVYSKTQYQVTVHYVDRTGNPIGSPTTDTAAVDHGTNYSPTAQTISGYVLAAWRVGTAGVLQNNTIPSVMITDTTDIYLVYGYDRDGDGTEDILVTKQFLKADGTQLKSSQNVIVNMGDIFNDVHDTVTGYDYQGYRIDNGTLQTGEPNLLVGAITRVAITVTGNTTVSYVYTPTQYTITVRAVDENGESIDGGAYDWTAGKGYQDSFTATAPTIQGYTYQSWKLDGTQKSGSIEIASVEAAAAVTLVYQKNSTPSDPEDQGNYKFVKYPNVKDVKPGETVTYTFMGFGNSWGIPLEKYKIIDKPDKGLDFVSASLPAFTNGSGITYDVIYYTNQQGRRVLHSDVPADQVFSFNAPALASGEYITLISLEFGTVPAGFAADDSITISFRVWDNPPSETLVNAGILSYKIGDEYKEFATGGASGQITISGYFGAPKTGDNSSLRTMLLVMLGSLGVMIGLPVILKRRRREKV